VASAGTRPAEAIAEGTLLVAERRHLSLLSTTPTSLDDVATDGDFVVAVCDNAFEELRTAVSLHWSVPDPVRRGDQTAFDAAYLELRRRIATLTPQLVAS
jgi:protein-tyrosine-phosphatase